MNVTVDIWLRGENVATTRTIETAVNAPSAWTDDDVRAVLEGMLLEMHRLRHPDDDSRHVALRGLSWIVNPYDEGGVLIAIEITMGAAVSGPFTIGQQALEEMIARVLRHERRPGAPTVH